MHLPEIKSRGRFKREVIAFGGLNRTKNFSEGDFSDGTAFSHLLFPALTQRQKIVKYKNYEKPSAAGFTSAECVAKNGELYYNGEKVCNLTLGEKQLVFMGVYVLVFPDKVCYNTQTEVLERLDLHVKTKGRTVTFSSNSISLPERDIEVLRESDVMEFNPDDTLNVYSVADIKDGRIEFSGYREIKASEIEENTIFCNNCLPNQYRRVFNINSIGEKYEVSCELVTVKNEKTTLFENFHKGDAVTIFGCVNSANNKTAIISEVSGNMLTFSEGGFLTYTETEEITFERKVPDFGCVCAFQNRLWGCEKNTIYASKLGDPFNFFVYRQLSTDSFTTATNTADDFTACIPFGNYCLFFKENSCYKLFGNRPSNFQLTLSFAGGIKKECGKSLAISGGRVFYKGIGGIYSFAGGIPQCISETLDNPTLTNAAGIADEKYYYLAADTPDGREMLVYNITTGMWSRWGKTDITGFSYYNGKVFAFREDGMYEITREPDDEAKWSVTMHPSNERYYGKKNYSKIFIRAELFENAWIKLEISKDGGVFYTAFTHHSTKKCHMSIPVAVRGCNEIVLRISGKGKSILESVVREFSVS